MTALPLSHASAGGTSRRPRPVRYPSQPSGLSIGHRDQSDQAVTPADVDAATLRKDLHRRAEISRNSVKWSDRLMEDTPDRLTLRTAVRLSYLHPSLYKDILHERHLNNFCSYPGCRKQPAAPYSPARRFKISTVSRTIREKEGNEDEGFCGRACEVRSCWIERQLEECPVWVRTEDRQKQQAQGIKLLEDLEGEEKSREATQMGKNWNGRAETNDRSGEDVHKSVAAIPTTIPALTTEGHHQEARSYSWRGHGVDDATRAPNIRKLRPEIPSLNGQAQPSSMVSDLISSLTIHERSTPSSLPTPPSIVQASTPPHVLPTHAPIEPPIISRRFADSSLVNTPRRLTTTLLSASRQMGPIPQLSPGSDEETAQGDWGEEAMGLTWGEENDEIRRLFAEAHAAEGLNRGTSDLLRRRDEM